VRRLRTSAGETLDEALVLWLPGPGSFTGEDSGEFHVHGGPAVVAGVLDALAQAGLRSAEPGEFTRRAFEHGRIDLAQAEAVADLIAAETGDQRRQALDQLEGALSRRYEAWRSDLLDLLALLEASIDFPDEDVPASIIFEGSQALSRVIAELRAALVEARGERVREGVRVALIGAPNVGKSSTLNSLVGRDAAIVTDVAGTTRDIVEVALVLDGHLVVVADTAGLRPTEDIVEAEGVRRARVWGADADLRIGIVDQGRPDTWAAIADALREGDIVAMNKSDLAGPPSPATYAGVSVVATRADEGDVGELRAALARRVAELMTGREFPAVTRARHRELLSEAVGHLERAASMAWADAELKAEDVRLALRSLERITGRSDPEAVLNRVFASFCIGK
jgi:tRNA modification GTPase